jgi:putative methylase
MGEPSKERLVRRIDLERFLSQIEPNPAPKASLEQYTISEHVAAGILYLAAYANGDVIKKSVLDLGCGTGRLALGAAFLGSSAVVGVDVDRAAVFIAAKNAERTGLKSVTDWIVGDIDAVGGRFETVLQNPPFGVQKRGADRKFLSKALEVGSTVYSLHNHPGTDVRLIHRLKGARGRLFQVEPSPFIQRYAAERGGAVLAVYSLLMRIPRMFDFHTKAKHEFIVDLYIIKKNT